MVAAMSSRSVIRSRANSELKRVGAVRAGREPGVLLLEGDRLVDEALAAGLALEALFLAESRLERAAQLEGSGVRVSLVADQLLGRVSALVTSPGILALCASPPPPSRSTLAPASDALVLVAAGIADPGNLGALARSAEAAGVGALCLAEGGASPWSAKALRGSMGSLLRVPVHCFETAQSALAALPEHRHVRAATRGGASARGFDWSGPLALWVGGETAGLPPACASLEPVSIPMAAGVESLNVTAAVSVLLFAAGRVG